MLAVTPLYVPIVFTAWGLLLWLVAGRQMVRDPRGEFRKMAEKRANSAIVQMLGDKKNADEQFEALWRDRWVAVGIAAAYCAGVIVAWVSALR